MIRVVIIGSGNIGTHLANAFHDVYDVDLVQVYGRSKGSLQRLEKAIPTTTSLSKLRAADVYILAVPDDAIKIVSQNIETDQGLIVHTSGGVDMSAITSKANKGVFYPLQTFSKNHAVDFSEVPICVEAERESDMSILRTLAKSISDKVYEINSEERAKIHLAAVFVNNFVNHLYQVSSEYLSNNHLPFEILKPLISETAAKIESLAPEEAQTGPARRNDDSTIRKHITLLKETPYRDIYQIFTQAIQNTYGKKL